MCTEAERQAFLAIGADGEVVDFVAALGGGFTRKVALMMK